MYIRVFEVLFFLFYVRKTIYRIWVLFKSGNVLIYGKYKKKYTQLPLWSLVKYIPSLENGIRVFAPPYVCLHLLSQKLMEK